MTIRARAAGWLSTALLRLQALTWRTRMAGRERLDRLLAEGKRVLVVFWHGKYVPLFALLRVPEARVFTSHSFRGDVISEISRRFGYGAVEIADHGGQDSLDRMREALRDARAGAVAVDGPLGPYHRVKRGTVRLASDLGLVVLPVSVASRRKRVLARWDRMEIPWPFTRVCLEVGEPIEVPPGLDPGQVDAWSQRLHDTLERLDEKVEGEACGRGSGDEPRAQGA